MKLETFESCGLVWLPLTDKSLKPDWLPDTAKVRWLWQHEHEDQKGSFDPYTYMSARGLFLKDVDNSAILGWYPVDESLVPVEPLTRDDSLPEGVSPPPAGWRFYGMGPVKEYRGFSSGDIALWRAGNRKWDMTKWCGIDDTSYYAIREGSGVYDSIWLTEIPVTKDNEESSLDKPLAILLHLSHNQRAWAGIPPSMRADIRSVLNDLEPARVQRIMKEANDQTHQQP